jgi:hypothetical protein
VEAVTAPTCDEFDGGFGWIRNEFLARCSHALVDRGRVWLVDPADTPGIDDRIREAGTPAGVLQLLDRHKRDCVAFANRLEIPHHIVPQEPIPPFEFLPIRLNRRWKEVALWWRGKKALVCADALGTTGYFLAGGERLGVHPLLRLRPPLRLDDVQPKAILCGHGEGVFDDADAALREALRTSRRRLPLQVASAARAWRARRAS